MCLLSICVSSLEKCLFKFSPFFNQVVFVVCSWVVKVLYDILYTNPSSDTWFANTFSHKKKLKKSFFKYRKRRVESMNIHSLTTEIGLTVVTIFHICVIYTYTFMHTQILFLKHFKENFRHQTFTQAFTLKNKDSSYICHISFIYVLQNTLSK